MSNTDDHKLHAIREEDRAKAKAEKEAKAAKAAERERLRSDIGDQALKVLHELATKETSLYLVS